MNFEELYKAEKAKREAAEAQVAELQGIVRSSREDERLVEAALAAGVPPKAAKACAAAMRRSAELTFDERGAFHFAELEGKVYMNPGELVHAFLAMHPNFTAEHIAAVEGRANGADRAGAPGAGAAEKAGEQFKGPEAWKNLPPAEMAEHAWKSPPPPAPPGPDMFAEFLEDRS